MGKATVDFCGTSEFATQQSYNVQLLARVQSRTGTNFMSFDKVVHSKPEFYAKKLDTIIAAKRLLYKLLLIDAHITGQREEIARKNIEVLDKHLTGKKVLEIGCGRGSFLAS